MHLYEGRRPYSAQQTTVVALLHTGNRRHGIPGPSLPLPDRRHLAQMGRSSVFLPRYERHIPLRRSRAHAGYFSIFMDADSRYARYLFVYESLGYFLVGYDFDRHVQTKRFLFYLVRALNRSRCVTIFLWRYIVKNIYMLHLLRMRF